jgi:MFS-type transporter involved in bile tolerance (Atg22 family)
MTMTTLKSIGAVIAGLIFIGVTHSGTDAVLESAGVLPKGHLYVSTGLILFVILYRALFSILGCYLTAVLAPKDPMKHSLILGGIGTLLSAVGAIATADMNLGPAWYAWSLVVIALPVAWLAGKIYILRKQRSTGITA